MDPNPTVSQLVSAGVVTNADVKAAVAAYLTAPDPGIVPLEPSHEVDITAAIAAHAFATKFLKSGRTGKATIRAAVRSSTLRPVLRTDDAPAVAFILTGSGRLGRRTACAS